MRPKLVSHISHSAESGDWTQALDHHPLGNVMKKALAFGEKPRPAEGQVFIAPQRLAVVPLPPKPDTNWGWRGHFSYGDTKVGDCAFREAPTRSKTCNLHTCNLHDLIFSVVS